MIRKGQKIHGPDEQGYEVTRDINYGDVIHVSDFKPFGGAPEPEAGMQMPDWLSMALKARSVA